MVDKQDMSWRRYNNVSIDTLYFSVFFGGSSPSFRAKKDEVRCSIVHNSMTFFDSLHSTVLLCTAWRCRQ